MEWHSWFPHDVENCCRRVADFEKGRKGYQKRIPPQKMRALPPGKKQKEEEGKEPNGAVVMARAEANGSTEESSREEDEDDLVALIEVLRERISYYKTELDQAERKLARLRCGESTLTKNSHTDDSQDARVVRTPPVPIVISKDSPQNHLQPKPRIFIPSVKAKTSKPLKMEDSCTKRKRELKEHREFISLRCISSSAPTVHCQIGCAVPSQQEKIEESSFVSNK